MTTLALSLLAILLSILAVFGHQWVTLVPRLGIGVLYHLRRIRVGLAALSIGLAGVAFAIEQSPIQGGLFVVVLVLTPLSGFLHAGRLFVPIDDPLHVPADGAGLADDAPVVGVEVDGRAHAWAVDDLIPHHVVNDAVGGQPVLAAWCAYCNSGIVYDPTVGGDRLTFEPLAVYRRNMVMRDRETGTLWQHATGEALTGPLAGTQLDVIGGGLSTWGPWRDEHSGTTIAVAPDEREWAGLLPRGRTRRLADRTERVQLPGRTATDERLAFTEAVVGVEVEGRAKAYPVSALRERGSIGDVVAGVPVSLTYEVDADRVRVTAGGASVPFQRTRWMGWFEFHPDTAVYEADPEGAVAAG